MRRPDSKEIRDALELAKGQGGLVRLLAEIIWQEVLRVEPPKDRHHELVFRVNNDPIVERVHHYE